MFSTPYPYLAIFIVSIIVFAVYGIDRHRQALGQSPLSNWLLLPLAVIAPFGALMAVLLLGTRRKSAIYYIIPSAMLIIWLLLRYLVF
jgi:uncharacterized membrane protein YsdA (DUF1294 family)